MPTPTLTVWPLALLAGLLPLLGTTIAYPLSIHLGLVDACNPFIDGCTSISRAARHDLPNYLFRALLLPAAALQAWVWWLCAAWLRGMPVAPMRASTGAAAAPPADTAGASRYPSGLPWVGVAAACFLVLYGTFLGTEGDAYRWMRRYGIVVYFGGTALAMLFATGALRASRWREHALVRTMLGLCIALPLLGLANALVSHVMPGPAARDAVQNVTEWWGGLLFTLYFFALAALWRVAGFELRVAVAGAGPD
jgi:NADH:ubiquinone oxidoreductase subunit 6 (subunit J)